MDDFKDLGFEESFDDIGFEPEQAEQTPKAPPTKTESFLRGASQGSTMGFGDEIIAGAMNLLEYLPGSGRSQDEELRAQGFQLPESASYKSIRDDQRALDAAAEKANPMTFGAGNLAGGIATAPLAGGLNTVKGATTGAKIADAAKKAGALGAAAGAGFSNAEDVAGLTRDVATGAVLGAGTGGLIQASPGMALGGAGLGAIGGAALSDDTSLQGRAENAAKYGALGLGAGAMLGGATKLAGAIGEKLPGISRSYQKGANEGVKTYSKEFAEETSNKAKTLVDDVTNAIEEAKANKLKDTQNNLKKVDEQIGEIETGIRQDLKNTAELQKGINEGKKTKVKIGSENLATKIQERFGQAKKSIGDTYDKIETEIPEETLFSVSDDLFKLQQDLEVNGKLGGEAQALVKRFAEADKIDNLTFQELRNLRNKIAPFLDSGDPAIKKSFSNLYKNLNNTRANTLRQNPATQQLADTLAETDKRYAAVLDMEDAFLGKVNYDKQSGKVFTDRILKENIDSPDANRLVNNLLNKETKRLEDTEFMRKMSIVDPAAAQDLAAPIQSLMDENRAVQNFAPVSTNADEAIASNPELMQLRELRDKLLAKPKKATQTDRLMNAEEADVRDYLGNNLKHLENATEDTQKSNLLNVLDTYKQLTGKDISNEATEIVKDIGLVKDASEPIRGAITPRSVGFLESFAQPYANMAGRAERMTKTTARAVSEGDILGAVNYLRTVNTPEARVFERQLAEAVEKSPEGRNAVMFGLMQQPAFRAIMNNNKQEEKEK